MSCLTFLSDNLVDSGSYTITTGAENAQFPISNLTIDSTAKKFRSVGNTIVFEIDLGINRAIDTIAVTGDATGTFGLTSMSMRTSLTTDFSGSPVTVVDLSSEHNIGYKFLTEVSHRYVEITISGNGSFAEVGKLFVGKRFALEQNGLSVQSFRYGNLDRSVFRSNDFGQRFIDTRNKTRFLSGRIEFATRTEFESLDDLFLFHGKSKPLWLIVDPDNVAMVDGNFRLSVYGWLDDVPDWSAAGGQTYNAQLRLNQVV